MRDFGSNYILVKEQAIQYKHLPHPSPRLATLCGWDDAYGKKEEHPITGSDGHWITCPNCIEIWQFCRGLTVPYEEPPGFDKYKFT